MNKVGIICFAGCYIIATVLDFRRLKRPSTLTLKLEQIVLAAGLFAHTAFLYYRSLTYERLPLSSQQDWILVIAWVLACLTFFLISTYREKSFGAFLLPGILMLLAGAKWFAGDEVYASEPADEIWGMIHGASMMLTTVSIFLGFLSGIMYLQQAWLLKHPRRPRFARHLPSLEWLHRANCHAMKFSAFFLVCGIFSGHVLNEIAHHTRGVSRAGFHDPFILGATILLVWYLASYAVSYFWKFSQEGHQVAYRTILSFVAFLLVLALGFFTTHRHNQGTSPRMEIPQVAIFQNFESFHERHDFLSTKNTKGTKNIIIKYYNDQKFVSFMPFVFFVDKNNGGAP